MARLTRAVTRVTKTVGTLVVAGSLYASSAVHISSATSGTTPATSVRTVASADPCGHIHWPY